MAVRRMIAVNVVSGDAFLDLPVGAQALYFHLVLQGDDDGFVNSPRGVMRMAGAAEEDLQRLIDKGYLLSFGNGVVAITHWRVHNLIRKDRYTPTRYREQLSALTLTDNGEYVRSPAEEGPPGPWQPDGSQTAAGRQPR